MMLALAANISFNFGYGRLANSKCSIPVLPGEIVQFRKDVVHPTGLAGFEFPNQVRERLILSHPGKDMHMNFDSADGNCIASLRPHDTSNVFVKSGFVFARNYWNTILR